MKNRSCPARRNCRGYEAESCKNCGIGNAILRLQQKIKSLEDENAKLKERAKEKIGDQKTLFNKTEDEE